ncbi:PDDEXK nuclease domain-containing protein [uncultured Lamprocystis sp.]|nr:PDDEXK nuclease domain-containing protein [uncultured Lamprocystis sp.]
MTPIGAANPIPTDFAEIARLIESARHQALQAVNTTLIDLYWQVGAHLSRKLETAEWGDAVVQQLADYLARTQPGLRGFTRSNLFRMRQFYETYREDETVAPLVRQISWTHHLMILGQCKRRDFLIELGRDFCFVGSQVPLQVGGRDFVLDLLFFHRGLNCLVDFELKLGRFEPEYLGTLEFYLDALDRDLRKPHENPAIGVLLCASKDDEVVEYALSRSLSPALVAEYRTRLPDKRLLQAKLHEFYALNSASE